MKFHKVILTAAALMVAGAMFADEPIRRTVIIKDGKVISNGEIVGVGDPLVLGKRPYLGVVLTDITSELREHYGASKSSGVLVGSVEAGSPAEKAGLRVGDVILAIDGSEIASSGQLRRALHGKKEGESVRIEVLRNRSRQALVATVIEREGPRVFSPGDIEELTRNIGTRFNNPEWKARVEALGGCTELQSRIRELEGRLKDLERKLQK